MIGLRHDAGCMFFREGFPATINHFEASRLYFEALNDGSDPIAHARRAVLDTDAHRATVARLVGRIVRRAEALRAGQQLAAAAELRLQAARKAARKAFPAEWSASEGMTDGRARREAQRLLRQRAAADAIESAS